MSTGILFLVFVISSIFLALIYNKLFIRNYPDHKRKSGYSATVMVFLLVAIALFGVTSLKSVINSTADEYSYKLEQYVKDYLPDNEFVRHGLDLTGINNDISQIDKTINELKSILPSNTELGVNKFLYDLIVDYLIKELQKNFTVVNYSVGIANSFSDTDNLLTVSSITNGLRTNITKLVNTISQVIFLVIIALFAIYIIYTLAVIRKEKKRNSMQQ
jgi:preprotein translocase subunit SecG